MSRIERKPAPPQKDFMIGWICVLDVEYIAETSILDEEFDSDDMSVATGIEIITLSGALENIM